MDATIICALISAFVTLIVSIGTWHVSIKKDREKAKDELRTTLNEHYEKTQTDIRALHDNINNVNTSIQKDIGVIQDNLDKINATVQNQIGIIEIRISDLTRQVEKHNSVIERTYALEQDTAVLKEKVSVANHRIEDLEKK